MLGPGARRQRLARTLNAAYAEGLLSERTLNHRLDLLFADVLIDPAGLVGDLSRRVPRRRRRPAVLTGLTSSLRGARESADPDDPCILLALDWTGACEELVIGRDPTCDVILADDAVSRVHARLVFRDDGWILQDLDSTNGTRLNGRYIGRCRLRPGDRLVVGRRVLQVD